MSVPVKRRSRLVGVVLVPVPFTLARYKTSETIEFQANGDTKFDFVLENSRDSMVKIKQICETVRAIFLVRMRFVGSSKVKDVTPAGGHLMRRVTSDKPFIGKTRLSERDGKYHFKYYGTHGNNDTDFSDFKTRIAVSMLGKVTRSSLGRIWRNRVVLEDLDLLTYGVEITAEKGSPGSSSSRMSGKKTDAASSSANGFPAWAWVAVGVGVLVATAGLAFIAGKRRGTVKAAARRQGGIPGEGSYEPFSGAGTLTSPQQQDSGDGSGQDL